MADPGQHRLIEAPEESQAPTPLDSARPRRGRSRIGLVIFAAAATVAIAAAAATLALIPPHAPGTTAGRAVAADYIDIVPGEPGSSAGMAVRRVPSKDAGDPDVRDDALVAAILTDLTSYWSGALPPITGKSFTPLRGGLTAVDSMADSGSAPCVATPADIVGNAYYCPSADGIVYDATTLVPVVLHRYGVGGLITTFAHEFGHAVQARIDNAHAHSSDPASPAATYVPAATPLTTEARADCDAGAFLSWVMAGDAAHLHLDGSDAHGGGDMPLDVIGPLVDFSDPATVSPDDPTAHGLAVDRLSWFSAGYRGGAETCARLGGPLVTALGRIATPGDDASLADTPRYATRQRLLTAAERSIDGFSGQHGDGTLPDGLLALAAPHGQFAQATVIALANAPQGSPVAAACFAGSWVNSVFGHAKPGELGSWPGDADEGLAAVLLQPGATFNSAAAYIDGFQSGHCS